VSEALGSWGEGERKNEFFMNCKRNGNSFY
jgi:hypothetical protein